MKLKFTLIIVGILLILPIGFSDSITKFQPGNLSEVNITFLISGSNSTYYFQIPKYNYVTSAVMNVTGISFTKPTNIDTSSSSDYSYYSGGGTIYQTIKADGTGNLTTWSWKLNKWGSPPSETIYVKLYDYDTDTLLASDSKSVADIGTSEAWYTFTLNARVTNNTWYYATINLPKTDISNLIVAYQPDPLNAYYGRSGITKPTQTDGEDYHAKINFISTYPSNSKIDISNDGDFEFSQSGELNSTNTTSDFSSEINNWLLNNCTSSICNISINVSSDPAGIIKLSALNISYKNDTIDDCSAYNNTILNFTLKDEEEPTTTLNGDIEIVIETPTYNYTFSGENVTNYSLCLAPSQSSVNITKAMIEYSSEGYESSNYSVRNYYLYDATLYSNSTQDIGLYLLKDTVGENVLFHTTDSAGANYPNVYGKIQRYYVGENVYRTVAMIYTDDQGEALTNLDLLDTWYKFILEKDGTVLKNTNPTKITSDEYYFKIYTTTNAFENYLSALNLSYTFTYNSTTNITKLEYNSASGLVRSVCLDIENVKLSGRTSIYSHCENSTSATIFYDLTNDTESGKYFAYASVINNNGNKQTLDVIEITRGSSESQNTFGTEGVALTALGAGTAIFIGIANPIAPIVLGLLTMVGLIKFGFFNLGTATLVSLSTAGGILIYYLRRK